MSSTAAGPGAQSLPDMAPVPPPVEPTFCGDVRSYVKLLRRQTMPSHSQDTPLDQTLVHALYQLSLSSSPGTYQHRSGGYGDGSSFVVPVHYSGVDRQSFLGEGWGRMTDQLEGLNMGNPDTRDVESYLSRDCYISNALASGPGQPSDLNGNGVLLDSGRSEIPSGFIPSRHLYQNRYLGDGGPCSACGGLVNGQQLGNRNSMRPRVNNNIQHDNRMFYWYHDSLSFEDLRGRMVAMAKDQQGCRCLQNILDKASRERIDMVFSEVIDKLTEMMVDPFANHVVQKLVDVCSEEQRISMVGRLANSGFQVVKLCLNQYGAKTVQKLLEKTNTYEPVSTLIRAISPGTVTLMKDSYGHHVIQHCLKNFSAEDTKCILKAVTSHCVEVATDKTGCCVLQQCVESSNGEQRDHIVGEIIAHALVLAENCYGNYVVQHILGLKDQRITANLLRELEGHFVALSCNKYGSNVVEKCLVESGEILSRRIVVELLESPNVSLLLVNNYGNYVIQSALSVSTGPYYSALVNLIRLHYPVMRNNLYGKRILEWFAKRKPPHIQQCT